MSSTSDSIDEKSFQFLCNVIRFARTVTDGPGIRRLIDQLVGGASGSIPANRQEALGASSRREFIRFNEIALRGAKETTMWLRACVETGIGNAEKAGVLLDEVRQIARILGAIVVRTKRSR